MSADPLQDEGRAPRAGSGAPFDIRPYLKERGGIAPYYATSLGALFAADCMAVLPLVADGVIDTILTATHLQRVNHAA